MRTRYPAGRVLAEASEIKGGRGDAAGALGSHEGGAGRNPRPGQGGKRVPPHS